jgi:hypothetical protein
MFTAENISDAASASLAGSFLVNLPILSEYVINGGVDLDLAAGAQEVNGNWVPAISDIELAVFLARAGSHPLGAELLVDGVSSYQETVFNMALMSGNTNAISDALDRIVGLQSALDGAMHGQLIESAEAEDARREAIVAGISTVVGAVPIPMMGEAFGGLAGFVIDWGQAALTGGVVAVGSDGIANMWATQTENAVSSFQELANGEYQQGMRVTLATTLYQYFSDVDPTVLAGIEAPTGDLDVWYAEVGGDLQANFSTWVNADQPENPFPPTDIETLAQNYDLEMGGWAGKVSDYSGVVEYEDTH